MMNATFQLGGELIQIKVEGNNLAFFDVGSAQLTTLEGLRFSKAGVLKEFPDLKDDADWKLKAIERLKAHIKSLKTEKNKMFYVKDELIKWGYEALSWQKKGFRVQKFK